jgi:hypothetical protein
MRPYTWPVSSGRHELGGVPTRLASGSTEAERPASGVNASGRFPRQDEATLREGQVLVPVLAPSNSFRARRPRRWVRSAQLKHIVNITKHASRNQWNVHVTNWGVETRIALCAPLAVLTALRAALARALPTGGPPREGSPATVGSRPPTTSPCRGPRGGGWR